MIMIVITVIIFSFIFNSWLEVLYYCYHTFIGRCRLAVTHIYTCATNIILGLQSHMLLSPYGAFLSRLLSDICDSSLQWVSELVSFLVLLVRWMVILVRKQQLARFMLDAWILISLSLKMLSLSLSISLSWSSFWVVDELTFISCTLQQPTANNHRPTANSQ